MKTVLIIEDDEEIIKIIDQLLKDHQLSILHSKNGDQGIKEFRKNDVDLIITDVMLPKRDGLDIVAKVRKSNPNIPIIALSGYEGIQEMAYLTGVNKFLKKPFQTELNG